MLRPVVRAGRIQIVAIEIDIRSLTGLSAAEAAARLLADGPNELPASRRRNIWRIAWEVVREPMFLLLVACGSIYLVLGDILYALLLIGFVFIVMGITFFQDLEIELGMAALLDLSRPRALVC